jgi:hypothetical protein
MLPYDVLKVSVAISHSNYVNRLWSTENVKQYLYSHSITKKAVGLVIRNAQNSKILKSQKETNAVNQEQVLEDH